MRALSGSLKKYDLGYVKYSILNVEYAFYAQLTFITIFLY
jgi:hypothetical protein